MAFLVKILACTSQKIKSSRTKEVDLEITPIKDNHSFNSWASEMNKIDERVRVHVDIGGVHFVTYRDTLLKVPNTRLAALAKGQSESLFFDRSSFLFEYILEFYRTGELHLPSGRCGLAIKSELEFWGLDETCISTCCWKTYIDSMEEVTTQTRVREEFSQLSQKDRQPEISCSFRASLWTFLEYPQSSKCAKIRLSCIKEHKIVFNDVTTNAVISDALHFLALLITQWYGVVNFSSLVQGIYAVMSTILVVVSLGLIMLGTVPEFQQVRNPKARNGSAVDDITRIGKLDRIARTYPVDAIVCLDVMLVGVVALEFGIKLLVCPNRWAFLKSFSTFSDIVFVLPIAIIYMVKLVDWNFWSSNRNIGFSILIQAMIALRVLRLHRLARCIRGFTVLALSLKASAKELFLLITLALSTSVVFAFAIFYAELTQEDTFPHAFMGMWWSLITITSVGYGDVYPKTQLGYLIGGLCAISGLILISLPVPMIANTFNTYYSYRERQERKSHCFWNGRGRCDGVDPKKSLGYRKDSPSTMVIETE